MFHHRPEKDLWIPNFFSHVAPWFLHGNHGQSVPETMDF